MGLLKILRFMFLVNYRIYNLTIIIISKKLTNFLRLMFLVNYRIYNVTIIIISKRLTNLRCGFFFNVKSELPIHAFLSINYNHTVSFNTKPSIKCMGIMVK